MSRLIPMLTEEQVESMLKACLGRLDYTAHRLGRSVVEIDRMIRCSEHLQTVFMTCQAVVKESDFERDSLTHIESEINRRLALYRMDGIEAIHDLAMMGISDQANMNQVKLLAASKLAGTVGQGVSGSSLEETLRDLDKEYHQSSPRIREIRERVVTFESEKVIDSQ